MFKDVPEVPLSILKAIVIHFERLQPAANCQNFATFGRGGNVRMAPAFSPGNVIIIWKANDSKNLQESYKKILQISFSVRE